MQISRSVSGRNEGSYINISGKNYSFQHISRFFEEL